MENNRVRIFGVGHEATINTGNAEMAELVDETPGVQWAMGSLAMAQQAMNRHIQELTDVVLPLVRENMLEVTGIEPALSREAEELSVLAGEIAGYELVVAKQNLDIAQITRALMASMIENPEQPVTPSNAPSKADISVIYAWMAQATNQLAIHIGDLQTRIDPVLHKANKVYSDKTLEKANQWPVVLQGFADQAKLLIKLDCFVMELLDRIDL